MREIQRIAADKLWEQASFPRGLSVEAFDGWESDGETWSRVFYLRDHEASGEETVKGLFYVVFGGANGVIPGCLIGGKEAVAHIEDSFLEVVQQDYLQDSTRRPARANQAKACHYTAFPQEVVFPGLPLESIKERMDAPGRHYHNLRHVLEMLGEVAVWRHLIFDTKAVISAIWYHDIVYVPGRGDNEELSAQVLEHELQNILPEASLRRAAAIIRATKDHQLPQGLGFEEMQDCAFVLDFDMARLAVSAEEFKRHTDSLAAEFAPVIGAEAWENGRVAFLRSLQKSPRVFHTLQLHHQWDEALRANLERGLQDCP